MTTQEKTVEIQKIVNNQQDNRAAVKAAKIPEGLSDIVVAAMNEAFRADLEDVFAVEQK